jgi:hypothetical protein
MGVRFLITDNSREIKSKEVYKISTGSIVRDFYNLM